MVRPAFWKDATSTDIKAILKRAIMVVNSKRWIYIRLATEQEVDMFLIPRRTQVFFKAKVLDRLIAWKEGDHSLPEGFDDASVSLPACIPLCPKIATIVLAFAVLFDCKVLYNNIRTDPGWVDGDGVLSKMNTIHVRVILRMT